MMREMAGAPRRDRGRALRLLIASVGYAAPPPGYVPYPYSYPAPYPMYSPVPPRTAQGIGHIRSALALGAATQAIYIPGLLWLSYLAATGGLGFQGQFAFFVAGFAFQCVGGIVGFIGALLFLLGAYYCHEGREEYGLEHARNMEHALIFLVLAFVMGVIASAGGSGFSSALGGSASPFGAVGGVFAAARGIFVGLVLRSIGKAFLSKEDLDLGWLGTAILTASPAIGSVASFALFAVAPGGSGIEGRIALALVIAAGLAAAELFAFVLFLHLFSKVYRRLRSGEIPMVQRPPLLYTPYYAGPAYYPYPVAPTPEPPPTAGPPPETPPP